MCLDERTRDKASNLLADFANLCDNGVNIGRFFGPHFLSGTEIGFGRPYFDRDVVVAKEPGGGDASDGIDGDHEVGLDAQDDDSFGVFELHVCDGSDGYPC